MEREIHQLELLIGIILRLYIMIICLLVLVSITLQRIHKKYLLCIFNDFLFLGYVFSVDNPNSENVFIYKIGDYANVTEVNSFINEDNAESPPTSVSNNVIIGVTIGSILVVIVLGFVGFIIFKRYRKSHRVIKTP